MLRMSHRLMTGRSFLLNLAACLCLGSVWLSTPLHAETWSNRLNLRFVKINAGKFTMGNPQLEDTAFELPDGDIESIQDETPPHLVQITQDFWLGETEVTQAQWFNVMGTRPGPDALWRGDWKNLPVVSVSWEDTQRFIRKLNALEKSTAYRLPTEAEWEYAARAGSVDSRPFPKTQLAENTWYIANSGDHAQPVATKPANRWGVYDMLGNVWEWVGDYYQSEYYSHSPRDNPSGPDSGTKRVRRGGSYHCQAHLMRVNYRAADTPDTRYTVLGFRVVREVASTTARAPKW
ncbi:MAG: formylglycine-generating enzyme family protein [Gammaproteobacteria bacterium]|nr:formylglycine-generating enzyme family protein [Gammaproteobacteria bacterium]